MEYYYTPAENISGDTLLISGEEASHITRVLRKKEGDLIYVTDGRLNLFRAVIRKSSRGNIECTIKERQFNVNEPAIKVSLFQCLLKNPSRFEFTIEKAVELGAFEITPVISENVVNKKTDRLPRWNSIALSAMKQSQRCYLPPVNRPLIFSDAVETASKYGKKIIAHMSSRGSPLSLDKGTGTLALFTGPEGGFSENEVELAVSKGFSLIALGPRKLRSETASIAALSIILAGSIE